MAEKEKDRKMAPYYTQPVDPDLECPELDPMYENVVECPVEEEIVIEPEEEAVYPEISECCYTDPALDLLRESLAGELEAVSYYQEMILQIPDCKIQQMICEVMNDEKFHVANQLYLLAKYDHVQNEELEAAGWHEAGEEEYTGQYQYRHGQISPHHPPQMMDHLMHHMLEKIKECVAEFFDQHLEEDILEQIYQQLPRHIKDYLRDHLSEEDPICQMPPQLKDELIRYIMHYLPRNICDALIKYVMECCARHLEQVTHEHMGGHMGGHMAGPMAGQVMQYCQAAIAECICYYILDYFLDYLEEELDEVEVVAPPHKKKVAPVEPDYYGIPNDCPHPVAEAEYEYEDEYDDYEDEYDEDLECPKGESHSKVCDVCPPWLPLVRKAMIDELRAINMYRDFITRIPYPDIQEALCAAMNTEKEHVATMAKILRMCDYTQAEEFAQFGWKMPPTIY